MVVFTFTMLIGIIQFILLTLKLTDSIEMNWLWIVSPMWMSPILFLIALFVFLYSGKRD
jgi:hypothetical protein